MLGVRKNPRKPPESSDEEDDDDNEEVGSNVGSLANAMEEDEDDARHGNGDRNADDADLEGNNTTAFTRLPQLDFQEFVGGTFSTRSTPNDNCGEDLQSHSSEYGGSPGKVPYF